MIQISVSKNLFLSAMIASAVLTAVPVSAEEYTPSRAAKSLYDGGARKCLYHLDLLVKGAHEDDGAYAFVTTLGQPADKAGYTLITVENVGITAATRTFAVTPDESNGCSVSTTLVMPVSGNCAISRDKVIADWKFLIELGVAAGYELEGEPESTVVLVPTEAKDCLLIKSTNQSFIGDDQIVEDNAKKDKKKL
jgi:hypothetical protein